MKYDSYKRMFKGVFQLYESEFIRKVKELISQLLCLILSITC